MEDTPKKRVRASNTAKDPHEWTTGNEPMTDAQRLYLETLSNKTGEKFDVNMTKAEASRKIEELKRKQNGDQRIVNSDK